MDNNLLSQYKLEVTNELVDILDWWLKHSIDIENGGFYGKIDNRNITTQDAVKGLVLNSRILYTFSSAYTEIKNKTYLTTATRAFNYLTRNFYDETYGGFYWSVNKYGEKHDAKKQIYGQAFAIYGLTEFYKISDNETALNLAINTFYFLEKHSYDVIFTGYVEALSEEWLSIENLRLSEKDQNEKKSMNTHLHIIEAYSNLYIIWPNETLKRAIKKLLLNFRTYIFNNKNHHLNLFFDENWKVKSSVISYGHDIEAAWLLQECAEIIKDESEVIAFKEIALLLTDATIEALDQNGGLWYEYDPKTNHWNKQLHWWPQAEAMVGFFNAWQITREEKYLHRSIKSWRFIKDYLKDVNYGEWFWGLNSDYSIMIHEDKAGFWKCPYHNGRACLELIKRITQ